jgi:hypothetical protein
MMINPVNADVTVISLKEDSYSNDENFTFIGTESEGAKSIFVIIRSSTGKYIGMISDPVSDPDGSFETISRPVDNFFKSKGTYNATAFADNQQESQGIFLLLNYDGDRVSVIPNFVLDLKKIGNKSVNENETLSFTATATDSSLKDLEFKLDQNPPSGATIDSSSGLFSWTPTATQGPASYIFDIVVLKGPSEDRETITVTVSEPSVSTPPPEPTANVPNFVDPKQGAQYYLDRYNKESAYKDWFDANYPDYTIQEAIELAIPDAFPKPTANVPNFVDPKQGAQYYLDRYNKESAYKDWFDANYPDYTIQEAIELAIPDAFPEPDPPKKLAPFVDPKQDPQYYIDRYNNEPTYKEWFDENFPDQTIYDAVGVEPPKTGICGTGTKFVNGVCVVLNQGGGGCLIATAAYGSEMSSQVQFLREIRDNTVLATDSGNSFMGTFNSIYYSFSPTIADWERQSPIFKNIVQTTITPLLTTLSFLNAVEIDSEEEMLGYGIGIIFLNLGIYFAAPVLAIIKVRKYLNN